MHTPRGQPTKCTDWTGGSSVYWQEARECSCISPKERTSAQVKSLPKSRNARVAVGGCCCACRFTCSALAKLELLHLWFGLSWKY